MTVAVSERKRQPFAGDAQTLNCPATAPFLKTLVASILSGGVWNAGAPEPHDLPALTIYLPSRAAVEPLKLEFLWQSPNKATFLPRIRVLGEADPLDLFATFGARMASSQTALDLLKKALAIPPAFDDLERRIHLAGCIMNTAEELYSRPEPDERPFSEVRAASAAAIARDIAALIDEADQEAADFSLIDRLDSAHTAGHEQLARQLLRAVRKSWQAHKTKAGKLDPQERRNRLMAIEAAFIRQSDAPVIVAGSTGSVAATMALMATLKARANSAIVLHGLDRDLDAASWEAIGGHPEHPKHGLHRLLARLDLRREDIRDLEASICDERVRRARFLSEALRPASTTAGWAAFAQSLKAVGDRPAPGLSLIEAESIQEEAAAIALILREALETKDATVALVTPDEKLIARVRHALTQWGLPNLVAAAGPDAFASRVALTAAKGRPEDLVALLRAAQGEEAGEARRLAEIVDLGVLRQMWRPSSMAGAPQALERAEHAISSGEARHPAMRRIEMEEWEATRADIERVVEALSPLTSNAEERLSLSEWAAIHAEVMTSLSELGYAPAAKLPTLETIASVSDRALMAGLADYAQFFAAISQCGRAVSGEDPHPRLFLRSPLDFRLLSADVIVLAGLNEGCWPSKSGPSPWLNQADRAFVGLSPETRRIGQSAQDFAALATVAPRVVLTRSRRVDGGVTRPSRWIARIVAIAKGAERLEALNPDKPWLDWARQQRTPSSISPVQRPAPVPPLSARPRRMSVTAIETWFANPYAIYARYILGLEPLSPVGETQGPRDKGILYHAALHRFFEAYPRALPENGAAKLLHCLDSVAMELGFNLENAPFWRPRFARFAEWFASTEGARRADITALKSEVDGKLRLDAPAGPFEIIARADRIDLVKDGAVRIYDFKTSANAAKISAGRGAPQLALEGLLAAEGAFAGVAQGAQAELSYIVATGGQPPGEVVPMKAPSAQIIEAARSGVIQRIERFDDPATPYAYETRAIFRDKAENDPYAHLARVKEWSAGEVEGEDADDE